MSEQLPPTDVVARARRSGMQRLLLTVAVLLTTTAMTGAALAGWAAWTLQSIDRAQVDLDERDAGGPANYLIVGSDTRSGGDPVDPGARDDRAPLADTIMLLRVDPGATSARVLSLPRDLWVTLPTTGEKGRINAAYAAGPQELVDTLRAELDVPINHYVEVDFQGFQKIVSAIDGVPMWFDRAMRDDNSGLNVLHPGCVTLDGPAALSFARARHLRYFEDGGFSYDGTGDLGRISRQQAFVRRVIDRARSKGLTNPLTLKTLVDVGASSTTIDAGLSVSDLVALGRRFSAFDSADLISYTLPNTPRTTDGGAQIVEVDPVSADAVLDLFRPVPPPAAAGAEIAGGAGPGGASSSASSDVTVTVLNSSGRRGLAVEAADDLTATGFEIDHFGNGDERGHPSEAKTIVRYGPDGSAAAETVAAAIGGSVPVETDASLTSGEVVLFLGDDFSGLDPTSESPPNTTTVAGGSPSTSMPVGVAAAPAPSEASDAVGIVPGDPPAGRTCG